MTSVFRRLVLTVTAALSFSGPVIAQTPVYRIPFLGAYEAQRQANQAETLRAIQALRELQEAGFLHQQQEALQQEMRQQQREEQRREAQQRQAQIEEIQSTARKSIADRSKGACVELFLKEPSGAEILSQKGTTVGQFCSCVEQEMLSIMTLELAGRLLIASNEFAGDGQRFAASPVGQEYTTRLAASFKGCSEQINRR